MPTLTAWMLDTLIATTLLCVLVLAVRRPVARTFGPGLAYALWLLPALRMLLPPLPAFLPSLSALWPAPQAGPAQDFEVIVSTNAQSLPQTASPLVGGWPLALLIVWVGGALLHLGWQYWSHRRLLGVLAEAETISWVGRVRIVSSPAVSGPLSIGLLNPMIVLPDDSRLALSAPERDLAVAHELAHHRRGDLWANGAAVLFTALHWFNPIVHYAWRAFRFDQESACDALVLAGADGPRRGTYARALAKAASGRPSAFAASMMGSEKLKERLTMLIQPTRSKLRRRIGLGLATLALVGSLGLTASTALADPAETPTPPTPPAVTTDGALSVERSRDGAEEVTRIVDGDRTTIILRTDHPLDQAEIDRLVAQARASRADATVMAGENQDGRQIHRVVIHQTSDGANDTALPAPPEPPMPPVVPGEHRSEHAFVFRHGGEPGEGSASATCDGGDAGSTIIEHSDGAGNDRATVRIVGCGAVTNAIRVSALRAARQALVGMATNDHLTAERLAGALARIDAQIAELERAGS